VSLPADRQPTGVQWECWDLPRRVLENQPQLFWSVACGHDHNPRCAVVVADTLKAATSWAGAYTQQQGGTGPVVLAWYGAPTDAPTVRQHGGVFTAVVPVRVLDTGAGATEVFAEAAKAVLLRAWRVRKCVML
jgi:hypothetical protein